MEILHGRLKSNWEMDGVTCWLETATEALKLEGLLERCGLLDKEVRVKAEHGQLTVTIAELAGRKRNE